MRQFLLVLIISLMLTSNTLCSCTEGCLRCNTILNHCLVCDSLNLYYLSGTSCNKANISNCYQVDQRGNCSHCVTGYYYDDSTQNCEEVPRAYLLQNCILYSRFDFCKKCNADSYITSQGNCLPIPVKIPNCNEYQIDNPLICVQCFEGFVLSAHSSSCVAVTELQPDIVDSNCGSYTRVSCLDCQSPFMLSKSAYANFQAVTHDPQFTDFLWNSFYSFSDRKFAFRTCEMPSYDKCLKINPYTLFCELCEPEYYQSNDSGKCLPNPDTKINFCQRYLIKDFCLECDTGKHPSADGSSCDDNDPIDNCEIFNNASFGTTKCLKCFDEMKVISSGNECTERTSDIPENCKTVQPNSDDCQTCSDGFRLSDDNKLCLPIITNCAQYNPSSITNNTNTCAQCNDTFGYNTTTNICEVPAQGAVENCAQYTNDSGDCISCLEGFYKESSNNICLKHNPIWDCAKYSGDTKNSCDTCSFGFVKLNIETQCLSGIKIPNCIENSGYSTCELCEEGFFGPNCDPIPYSMKCLKVEFLDPSVCIKCFPNYFLTAGNCVPASFADSSHCLELGTHSCKVCRPFSLLYGLKNYKICQPRNKVNNLQIPNCLEYDIDNSQCIKCDTNYYLDENTCQKFCPAARPALILHEYKSLNGIIVLYAHNKCINPASKSNPGCLIFVPSTINPLELVCAKCKSGAVSSINFATVKHHMYMIGNTFGENTSHNNGGVFEVHDGYTKPGLICSIQSSIDTINHCEYWSEVNTTLRCVKCQYGFKGEVAIDSGVSYISKCIFDFKCSRNEYLANSGLDMNVDFQTNFPKSIPSALLSCYTCTNSSDIPFIYAKNTTSGLVLQNYDITNTPTLESSSSSEGDEDFSHQCHNPSSFEFYSGSPITGFPSNCGIGLVDPSKTITTSGTSDYLQCLTCKPMYKATFTGSKVSTCSSIQNCQISWEFGRCSLCKIGYVWEYNDTDKYIDKTTCIEFSDRQCISGFTNSGNSQQICRICKDGLSPNQDGICDSFRPSFCPSGLHINKLKVTTSSHLFSLRDLLKFEFQGDGCISCSSPGLVNVLHNTEKLLCLPSMYAKWNNYIAETAIIPNCKIYDFELSGTLSTDYSTYYNSPKCIKCIEGYLETNSQTSCREITSSLSHCILVDSVSGNCIECSKNYLTISGQCQPNPIESCQVAEFNSSNSRVECILCNDGYYFDYDVSTDVCLPGKVNHCKAYHMGYPEYCSQCNDGYNLFEFSGSKSKCIEITQTNCLELNLSTTKLQQNLFTCIKCKPGFYKGSATENSLDASKNVCLATTNITGCKEIDEGTLKDNSYNCIVCDNKSHFLENSKCVLRNHVPYCETYHASLNECSRCQKGFYLSNNNLSCINDPTGVPNCFTHDPTGTLCIKCDSDYFPSDKGAECLSIPTEEKVTNCIVYDENKTCQECAGGFWWNSTECVSITANNCAEYANFDECKTCPPLYYLNENASTKPRNCMPLSISNCLKNSGNKCILCDNNYKLTQDGASCLTVTDTIPYCTSYDHETKCTSCQTPFILDSINNKCFIENSLNLHLDPNCSSYQLKPNCNVCKQGYYFNEDNKCTECTVTNCHFCERNGEKCSLCKTGYFMNIAGECTLNQFLDIDETEFPDLDDHTYTFYTTCILLIYLLSFK